VMTGGCQCGAVRYALYAAPQGPHICHCRMCQKAFGSYFAPLAGVALADFAWTRGQPKVFNSSDIVERGFCGDCGTPLSFRYTDGKRIAVSLGSLDHPEQVAPKEQCGMESAMPFLSDLAGLKGTRTEEDTPAERLARIKTRQHPDHDTDQWPLHA
jgi:hypothetical protein